MAAPRIRVDRRGGQVDFDHRTVPPSPVCLEVRGQASSSHRIEHRPLLVDEIVRNDRGRPSDDVLLGPAEDPLGAGAPHDHQAVEIDDDHGHGRCAQDRRQQSGRIGMLPIRPGIHLQLASHSRPFGGACVKLAVEPQGWGSRDGEVNWELIAFP
jgi:hypothetical protein